MKKTPLYETHLKYGGRMVPFAGHLLPVQFPDGTIREHMAVREACGIFDTCHMPEFIVRGPHALEALNSLLTNDYSDLKIGSARYGLMCDEQGGIIDDTIIHRLAEDVYMMPVNAATRETDFEWIRAHSFGADWEDISDRVGTLALQGPLSEKVLAKICDPKYIPKGRFRLTWPAEIGGMRALIGRTGYSGEDGFEIYVDADNIVTLWEMLKEAGEPEGLLLCGLGSRDTLRIEAGMPLYGREMDRQTTPPETALDYGISMDSSDFIGRDAIMNMGPAKRRRVGLKAAGRGIMRQGHIIYINDIAAGVVTSGTYCAYENAALAMGYLPAEWAEPGTVVSVDVRGRRVEAVVTALPFYTPPYKK